MVALTCATLAGPAMADVITCDLSGVPVRFEIDARQFAPALNPADPPRHRITTVQLGTTSFPAEPVMMGDFRGFSVEGADGTEMMMVMQDDGRAVLKNARTGVRLDGTCEVTQ